MGVLRIQHVDRDNQSLETELGRLEVQKQDLDDEVSDLVNVGKEIPQAGFFVVLIDSCRSGKVSPSRPREIRAHHRGRAASDHQRHGEEAGAGISRVGDA